MSLPTPQITFPIKAQILFQDWQEYNYAAFYGGRGSAKSESVARFVLFRCMGEKSTKVLCARESQNSMAESVHSLLSSLIKENNFTDFEIQRDKIIHKTNGSTIIFKGLRQEAGHIRSMHDIDIVWIEEGQYIGRAGFTSLDDTIRKDGSIIVMCLNPRYADDPLYQDFVSSKRDDTLKINLNIIDNPFATEVQKAKAKRLKETDYQSYCHTYLGELKEASDSQIFKGKYIVKEFDPPGLKEFLYHGADWGFSQDPNAIIRSWIDSDNNLLIDHAVYGHQTEIEDLPALFDKIPDVRRFEIIADNARPETISFMQSKGFNIVACKKGKGSVEDGIERLRGFNKIIIHPRCEELLDEFRNYSYKIDPRTDKITSIIRDDYNHGIDALRYATENIIHKNELSSFITAFS